MHAGGWTKIGSKTALSGAGGKTVVETAVGRILLAEVEGTVFAVSNKCSHLGLPLIGKTALLQGEVWNRQRCSNFNPRPHLTPPEGKGCPFSLP